MAVSIRTRPSVLHPEMGAKATFEAECGDLRRIATASARRIVRDRATVEDVAAEAVARAWLHWDSLDVTAARRWVAAVARNLAVDVVRRRPPVTSEAGVVPTADDGIVARAVVGDAVRLLPARQRDAVVLRHLAGMSQLEIAATLGIARGTAAVHLSRAEAALRAHLSDPETTRRVHMQVASIEEAAEAMANGTVLRGTVTGVTDHGLLVDVGVPATLPARFVDLRPVEDLRPFVGRPVDCVVRGVHVDKGLVFVSRLHAVEGEDDTARRRDWFAGLTPGDRLPGTVASQVRFGWFVDVAGGTGLVHVSDAATPPAVGDRIEVEVLRVDVDAERLALRPV